ncbi:unnamed protein product [Mytilus coruscus]|uniref:Uncharacterized protein n=1 Tax=Mytilus coruscus TaxID=42192 RepID=A0A6J8BK61_MYTCO|nr:unnamed protein product [Mytilus coruscus]
MTTPKDGKQIANMLYHAGVETLLTVGYAEIGKKVLRRPAPKVDFNMNDVVMLSIDILLAMATKDMLIKQGSNYLFSHMGSNANEEKIRHDKAIEKLEKAQAEWNYFNLFRNMKDNKLIQEIEDALNFKGFPKQIEQSEEVESEIIDILIFYCLEDLTQDKLIS